MNFIIFFPDEMRAESLSCYGHNFVKTPNYDNLAKESVKFQNCFVQNTVCSPSRICMMTGKYPHVDAHRTLWNLLQPHEPSLFEYLKKDGYNVVWFGKNDLYSQESLKTCVDIAKNNQSNGHFGEDIYKFGEEGYYSFLKKPCVDGENTSDKANAQAGIDFLKNWKKGDKPFVLYLPLSMPHPVYSAPEFYHNMYDINQIELKPKETKNKPSYVDLIPKYRNLENFPEESFKKINAVYLGMISYVDKIMGDVLSALNSSEANDSTTFIATSDHGDFAGDYGLVEKWPNCFDDCLTRVPLIIKTPNCKRGHVVNEEVELIDIFPTIMELANVKIEHTQFATSLVPQINGANGDKTRAVFSEGGYNLNEPHCFEGYEYRRALNGKKENPEFIYFPKHLQQQENPQSVCRATMMRTLDYKLVYRPNEISEFYDLKNDKLELNNQFGNEKFQPIINKMLFEMLAWYSNTSDSVKKFEDMRGLENDKN